MSRIYNWSQGLRSDLILKPRPWAGFNIEAQALGRIDWRPLRMILSEIMHRDELCWLNMTENWQNYRIRSDDKQQTSRAWKSRTNSGPGLITGSTFEIQLKAEQKKHAAPEWIKRWSPPVRFLNSNGNNTFVSNMCNQHQRERERERCFLSYLPTSDSQEEHKEQIYE